MSRKHADYVYRNADDSLRLRVHRLANDRWDYDVFQPSGEITTYSTDVGDYFATKRDALAWATRQYGRLSPIAVEGRVVDEAWSAKQAQRKKTPRQLDTEIAHALAKPSGSKRPSRNVVAAFEHMADIAEAEGAENLSLGQGSLGYRGDPKEFRFSDIFARRIPSAKHERLLETIDEYSEYPHRILGRTLTSKEADWMRSEAKKIYDDERRHIEHALSERNR